MALVSRPLLSLADFDRELAPGELLELEARASGARVRLAVTEGKHRMVRRMLANLGLPVHRLVRREMGPVKLNDLAVGQWRPLSDAELGALPR